MDAIEPGVNAVSETKEEPKDKLHVERRPVRLSQRLESTLGEICSGLRARQEAFANAKTIGMRRTAEATALMLSAVAETERIRAKLTFSESTNAQLSEPVSQGQDDSYRLRVLLQNSQNSAYAKR
jgi:hypothetical protein